MNEIASIYNISKTTVNKVIQNNSTSIYYDPDYIKPDKKSGEANPSAKLSNKARETIEDILKQKKEAGAVGRGSITELARQFGISRATIYKIRQGSEI